MVIFHSYVSYVSLPEGIIETFFNIAWNHHPGSPSEISSFLSNHPQSLLAPPPERSSPSRIGKRGVSPLHSWTWHLPQVGLLDLASLNDSMLCGECGVRKTWRHLFFFNGHFQWPPKREIWMISHWPLWYSNGFYEILWSVYEIGGFTKKTMLVGIIDKYICVKPPKSQPLVNVYIAIENGPL